MRFTVTKLAVRVLESETLLFVLREPDRHGGAMGCHKPESVVVCAGLSNF